MRMGGGRALGVKTLKWLSEQEDFQVVAVCPIPYELDKEYHNELVKIACEKSLNICDISQLKELEVDIGLSVNYYRIIREEILNHCKRGFYNIHHSYNLRLRGRNITTHVILNTLKENVFYHGTTLHRMIPELDAGPIVASYCIEIKSSDTAFSLFQKADEEALCMIKEWMPRIAFQEVFPYEPPQDSIHYYKNNDLPKRTLNLDIMTQKEIDVYIRAFDYPGKEPAYFEVNGRKFHLVFQPRDQYLYKHSINGCTYYGDII